MSGAEIEEAWKENVVKHMQQLDGCCSPGTQPTTPTLALERSSVHEPSPFTYHVLIRLCASPLQ